MAATISFVGRLGRDAEMRYTPSGQAVCNFSAATNTRKGNEEVTDWFNCSMWGTRGEKLVLYLTKGKQVFINGTFTLRKYTGTDGTERTSPDVTVQQIELLGGGNGNGHQAEPEPESDEIDF